MLGHLSKRGGHHSGRWGGTPHRHHSPRRWRGGRSGWLCGRHHAAWPALHSDSHHTTLAGRFLRWRQNGHQLALGQESDRRFPSALCVLADVSSLATLPPREVVAGYAEIVKSGLIGQESLFAWCEKHGAAVLSRDPEALAEAVRQACAFKAGVVAADEREEQKTDGRALLNLGHTFGHALEAELGYDGRLLHGEAVSIGLTLAFSLSVKLGFCPQEDLIRVTNHLESLHMPAHISDLPHRFRITDLMAHMQRDKKMQDGRLSFVLAHGIGKAFTTRDVPAEAVREVLLADGATP